MIRFFHIWYVLMKFGLLLFALKLGWYKKQNETFVKDFFEEAGGSFVKFGQLLAMRVDFLPKEYALEMLNLLDNVKPFPYDDVKKRFLQELGDTPEKIFYDFQKEPFASASFGQVHAAKLDKHTIVAVKILRPGIEDDIAVDFIFIDILAFFADIFFRFDALPWKEFAKEYKKWTRQELDYHIEADHTQQMHESARDVRDVIIPKVYPRYSTRRILVQEYIEGVPLSRVLRGLKDGRLTKEELLDMGIDITKTPRLIIAETMRQYFYLGQFHADPHPGNILLIPGDKIAMLDFGIMGEQAPNQKAFIKVLLSGANMQYKEAVYDLIGFAGTGLKQLIESAFPATADPSQVDEFMKLLAEQFAIKMSAKFDKGVSDIKTLKTDYALLFMQIMRDAESYKIRLPKQMAVFARALSIVGFLGKELDREFKLSAETIKFFTTHDQDEFLEVFSSDYKRISRDRAIEELHNWLSFLIEKDPKMYHLVNKYIRKYNVVG